MMECKALLQPDFILLVCGQTRSGKSTFVMNLIHSPHVWEAYPDHFTICHQTETPTQYGDDSRFSFHRGVQPDMNRIKQASGRQCVFIDDLTEDLIREHKDFLTRTLCVDAHHCRLTIILAVHDIFLKPLRPLRLQASYVALFENAAAVDGTARFASQVMPGRVRQFLQAYKMATAKPHGYIFYIVTPGERFRMRGAITEIPQHLYDDETP